MIPRKFIYIAGPYRGGAGNSDHMSNCHDAMAIWNYFWDNKVCAICPHWSFAQQLLRPLPDVDWLAYTMAQMTLCSAVYRMPGQSSGSDSEVAAAKQLGIPVFHELGRAVAYMKRGCVDGTCDCGEGDCGVCLEAAKVQAQGAESQRCCKPCHNANTCVWRLADCSSGGHSPDLHGSINGPAV